MEAGVLVRSLFEFSSKMDGELSLKVGSVLQVIRSINQHWSYGCLDGIYGNFPTEYVAEIKMPENVISSFANTRVQPQLFIAKERFRGNSSHEMTMKTGDVILGVEPVDEIWYRGRSIDDPDNVNSKIFPLKYTWKVDMELFKKHLKLSKQVSMRGIVTMNLKAQLDEEIDLYENDIVNITEIIDEDWYRGTCRGKKGIFPTYVISCVKDEESTFESSSESSSRPSSSLDLLDPFTMHGYSPVRDGITIKNEVPKSSYAVNNNNYKTYSPEVTSVQEIVVPHAHTLFAFHGEYSNELSFEAGETILLKSQKNEEWLEGETSDGKRGIFPRCFVQIVIELPDNSSDIKTTQPNNEWMIALYDFYPQVEGDVPVMEGEHVKVLERPNCDWYKVENAVGVIGLCPASFLEAISENVKHAETLQRQWSIPVYSQIQRKESNVLCDNAEKANVTDFTSQLNDFQSSVDFNCDRHLDFPADSQVSSLHRQDSGSIQFSKMPPSRPPPPVKAPIDIPTEATSAAQIRVLRPAPAPPTFKNQHLPRRSLSAVGTSERRRSDVQLRHQQRLSQRRRVVTMSEVPCTENKSSKDHNMSSSDDNEVEFRSRSRSGGADSIARSSMMELKNRNRDKREMIIAELVKTEKDFINDMEFCKRNFLSNPDEEKRNGLDVDILFGHLDPIISVSKKLSKSLEAVSSQPSEHKQVGGCFLDVADEMREAYANYCCNHDEVVQLLEKYEENRTLTAYIRQKLEVGGCANNQIFYSLSSLVIKPIQRITKYPLLLHELLNVTEDASNDHSELVTALHKMTEVANTINELKRRKDLVQKYRKDSDSSISSKLAKINLHSVVKKSGRIGMRLSSSLGLTSVTKDWVFDDEEQKFHDLERSIKQLLLNVESFITVNEENVLVRLRLAERIGDFYDEERSQKIVDNFRTVQRIIATSYWPDFKRHIEKRVTEPLVNLLTLFEGPTKLIDKRIDKLLDYDRASQRLEKNKDANSSKVLRDELEATKRNYTALNTQLLEELPKLIALAAEIFVYCVGAFIHARSKFLYLTTTQLIEMAESIPNLDLTTDNLDLFINEHMQVVKMMIGQGLISSDSSFVHDESDSPKATSVTKAKASTSSNVTGPQSSSQRAYLQGRYQPNELYVAVASYSNSDQVEVPISEGDLVAVLIRKDPLGNTDRWFVDNGTTKGLVPAKFLAPFEPRVDSKVTAKSEKSPTTSTHDRLMPSQSKAHSRTPSPCYHEPEEAHVYEELNSNGFHHYYEICDLPENSKNNEQMSTDLTEYYEVAYDFRASGTSELSVARGQMVLILRKEDMEGNPEWWLARDRYGREGFVPGNYLIQFNS